MALYEHESQFVEELARVATDKWWRSRLELAPDDWYDFMPTFRQEGARCLAFADLVIDGWVTLTMAAFVGENRTVVGEVHNQLYELADPSRVPRREIEDGPIGSAHAVIDWLDVVMNRHVVRLDWHGEGSLYCFEDDGTTLSGRGHLGTGEPDTVKRVRP